MDTSSEYTFPIFISSTDYNLKDLRAELARFLTELGYRPILSSAEGFPDSSPILEPWESCLPVLDKCFVMVLIIDGLYGTALKWTNYKDHFEDEKYSPTHGEYIFAHKMKKRMLVFIRKSLMPHYQSYRTTLENFKNDSAAAKKALIPTLPPYVNYETLEFINKVKTTKPIPWINEFDDITSVKKEIQKKMLNELAELFLIKNKHIETVIDSFNKVMDSHSLEEQKKILLKVNATKEITEAVDKLEGFINELDQTKSELEKTKSSNTRDKEKFEKKISSLNGKITELEKETLKSSNSQFFIKNGQVKIGNPNFIDNSFVISSGLNIANSIGSINPATFGTVSAGIVNPATFGTTLGGTINPLTFGSVSVGSTNPSTLGTSTLFLGQKCDQCGKTEGHNFAAGTISVSTSSNKFTKCPTCEKTFCNDCWTKNNLLTVATNQVGKCPNCSSAVK